MQIPPTALAAIRRRQTATPVPVVALAKDLGLAVFDAQLPHGMSGKLTRDSIGGPSGFAIFVNRAEPEVRRRFTVAHEIGHFILHRKDADQGSIEDDTFYRSRLSNRLEAEANAVAADILMPWDLINALIDQGKKDPLDLAQAFRVSETAMRIRLGLPT